MKALFASSLALLVILPPPASAIPQSFFGNGFFGPVIPATPRFGANLTEDFLNIAYWDDGALPGPWGEASTYAARTTRRMSANPILFGAVPESVVAVSDGGRLQRVDITYLDAGTFFGFKHGGERSHADRKAGDERRSQFRDHYEELEADLRGRLEKGCGRGLVRTVGRSEALRSRVVDYAWDEFVIRLVARDGHSVGLSLLRRDEEPRGFIDPDWERLDRSERAEQLSARVDINSRGDTAVGPVPEVQQGLTPFCGIGALAMAAGYLGLQATAQDLEAAAGFRNTGSARGSSLLSVYHGIAEELGMRLTVSKKFDPKRVQRSLESGIPVVVWRRVSEQREAAHRRFADRLARDPDAHLPPPGRGQSESWPDKTKQSLPSHGSLVTGINPGRSEVVFSEPWGDAARDRRMRIEEMEATAYAVFYFRF